MLARPQRLEVLSAENTLAMPEALGQPSPLSDAETARHFNALWNAKPEEVDKVWEKIQGGTDNRARTLIRLSCAASCSSVLPMRPRDNLDRAITLTKIIGMNGNHRPIEAHFAAMLVRDLDKAKSPDDELVARALRCAVSPKTSPSRSQLDNSRSAHAGSPSLQRGGLRVDS